MLNAAQTVARGLKGIPVLLLISVLVSASVACAAMAPAPVAPTHPCCPKPGPTDPDHCGKTGCISNVPVLQPASITSAMEAPVVILAASDPLAEDAPMDRIAVSGTPFVDFDVFLRNQQLLI